MKGYGVGGIEVVAATLASCFVRNGHHVVIATFTPADDLTVARTDNRVIIHTLDGYVCSAANVSSLRNILIENNIQVVINQWGLPLVPCRTLNKARQGLMVQTNPVTLDSSDFEYFIQNKQKEIIYLGRIDYNQKRVYRVIDTWTKLEAKFPEWKLTIVGDGVERANIEKQVAYYGLKHVTFEGFQQPKPYYERASILLLTSEYEGFPLVLAECMSFGVIPAVYDSYSAVRDIIDDDKDGIVIPYNQDGFKADEAAVMLATIMKDECKRDQMALAAIKKSKDYSLDRIYQEWMRTFSRLGLK